MQRNARTSSLPVGNCWIAIRVTMLSWAPSSTSKRNRDARAVSRGICRQARASATKRHGNTGLVEFEAGFLRYLEIECDFAPDHGIHFARTERRGFDALDSQFLLNLG